MRENGDGSRSTGRMERWRAVFGPAPLTVIGVVHLEALPGSPDWAGDIEHVIDTALADVQALEATGVDALLVENFNDAPFEKEPVDPAATAAMAVVGREIYRATTLPLGYAMLKNDIFASLAVGASGHGQFTRAPHLSDAMVTDVGIVEGAAPQAARYRRMLGTDMLFIADIYCKHAAPLARRAIDVIAHDLVTRLKADALVLDGPNSALPPSVEDIEATRHAVPGTPLVFGSGTPASLAPLVERVEGVIIPSPREYTDPEFWSADPDPHETAMAAARRWVHQARSARSGVAATA